MCGIFGVISSGIQKYPRDQLARFRSIQHHRGPDDTGEYSDEMAYLGFNRLSIIDLSQNGHQPMCDPDRRYWIMFNGEIYNFEELKKRYLSHVNFRSKTDTEVLLWLYQQYHERMLPFLDGMFALAIWDNREKTLFLARDRFGEKPLWLYELEDGIAFASEIRTLVRTGIVPPEISPSGIFAFPWLGTASFGQSIINGVRSLQPAHFIFHTGAKKIVQQRYWDLRNVQGQTGIDKGEARLRVRELLKDSVERRLISDVPLGLFFSGGIDSSVIAAVSSKILRRQLNSYSIGFREPDYDESAVARFASMYYGLEHKAFTVGPEEVHAEIPHFVRAMDFPIADGINTYFVSRYAREKMTVALSGIGSDEIFGGYSTFRFLSLLKKFGRISLPRNKLSEQAFGLLPVATQAKWLARGLAYLLGGFSTEGEQHELVRMFFRSHELPNLFEADFSKAVLASLNSSSPFALLSDNTDNSATGLIGRVTLKEIQSYLSSLLLPAVDMFSMSFSLEVRAPFLSHELVEYVYSLPDHVKFDPKKQKSLLVESFQEFIPPEVTDRKKKGFGFPLERWIFLPQYEALFMDTLTSSKFFNRGFFSKRSISKELDGAFDKRKKKRLPHQTFMRLWSLLVLELWLREHIDA